MAITFVGPVSAHSFSDASVTVDLSNLDSGTIAADDVAVITVHFDDDPGTIQEVTTSLGPTWIHRKSEIDGRDMNTGIGYLVLDGTETNLTIEKNGDTGEENVMIVTVWRGVDTTNPLDVAFVEANHYTHFTATTNATADAITTNTDGAMVLLHECRNDDEMGTAGAPSGYTIAKAVPGNLNRQAGVYYKEVATAGTETPGATTHTGGGADDLAMRTIALKPAAAVEAPAVGERFVRRHDAARTSTANATAADITYDTDEINDGTGYSYSAPAVTPGQAGKYLCIFDLGQAALASTRAVGTLVPRVDGVDQTAYRATHRYLRNSGGNHGASIGAAILDLDGTEDVRVRNPGALSPTDAVGNYATNVDYGGALQLVRLNDGNFTEVQRTVDAAEVGTSDINATRPWLVGSGTWTKITYNSEVVDDDSLYSGSGGDLTLKANKKYLIVWGVTAYSTDASRHVYVAGLNIDGDRVQTGTGYQRNTASQGPPMRGMYLHEVGGTNETAYLECTHEIEGGDAGTPNVSDAYLQVLELPDGAEWIHADNGATDSLTTALAGTTTWYDVPLSSTFRADGDSNLSLDAANDAVQNDSGDTLSVLAIGSLRWDRDSGSSGTRKMPWTRWDNGGTPVGYGVSGAFSRGQQSADDCWQAHHTAAALLDLADAADLTLQVNEPASGSNADMGVYASTSRYFLHVQVLNLATLAPAAGGDQTVNLTPAQRTRTAQALSPAKQSAGSATLTAGLRTRVAQALSPSKQSGQSASLVAGLRTRIAQALSTSKDANASVNLTGPTRTRAASALSPAKQSTPTATLVAATRPRIAQALSVAKQSGQSVNLSPAIRSRAAAVLSPSVQSAGTVNLTAATRARSGQDLTVAGTTSGTVNLTAPVRTRTASALSPSKQSAQVVNLTPATRARVGAALSVSAGGGTQTVNLTPAQRTRTAQALSPAKQSAGSVALSSAPRTRAAGVLSPAVQSALQAALSPASRVRAAAALSPASQASLSATLVPVPRVRVAAVVAPSKQSGQSVPLSPAGRVRAAGALSPALQSPLSVNLSPAQRVRVAQIAVVSQPALTPSGAMVAMLVFRDADGVVGISRDARPVGEPDRDAGGVAGIGRDERVVAAGPSRDGRLGT